ncbi:MAG: STAS domain-containing protein [Bacteroidia bacterium]
MMKEQYLITKSDRYTLIQVQVEKLDTLAAPALKSEFVVLNNEGVKNMIIDLSETRYCDSSGLSAILVANRLCKNMGGVLIVTGLQEPVKKLINISQLDSILTIASDRTAAIDRLVAETVERGHHD